jgi:YidC/Oxa1 family membrane protein insertase
LDLTFAACAHLCGTIQFFRGEESKNALSFETAHALAGRLSLISGIGRAPLGRHRMSDIWYYGDRGKPVGPLPLADLTKVLSRVENAKDVLVWRDGFEHWQRAETVPELMVVVFKPIQSSPSSSNLPREPSLPPTAANEHEDLPQYNGVRIKAGGRRRNIVVAIVLSATVLIGWQYFYNVPQLEKQRATGQAESQMADKSGQRASAGSARSSTVVAVANRDAVIASVPRVKISTPAINGSISLKGARIDDVALVEYPEAVDPSSPAVTLLSPSGTDSPLYAEFGWIAAAGSAVGLPDQSTIWEQEGSGELTPATPVKLKYDNGGGLTFRRTISIDGRYLFTIKDDVVNAGNASVTLYPFALISRHGTPKVAGYYILHEGLIGYLGDQGLQQYTYKKIDDVGAVSFNVSDGWLGITDKYKAAALLPDTYAALQARFSSNLVGTLRTYQADYLQVPQTIAVGGTGSANARLFAGVKEAGDVGINFAYASPGGYDKQLGLNHFDLLIDWGWFYFITKPMWLALYFLSHLVGDYGVAILVLTAIVKLIFVPFTNQSYRSMMKLQKLQPQISDIRARIDDQEQADKEILELYKRENVTAPSGCLPIIIFHILLFFPLHKVLSVTIEGRSPFFGWITDLAAPDPTNLFDLFGLLPFDPTTVPLFGPYLHIGAWPVILGLTLWQLQRRISPTLLGSFQRKVYVTLPFIAAYFSSGMLAGLVISLAFYNFLSIVHQSLLMKETESAMGNVSEYSAAVLRFGKSQPIIFLMMLAPVLQTVLVFAVFWRPGIKRSLKSSPPRLP